MPDVRSFDTKSWQSICVKKLGPNIPMVNGLPRQKVSRLRLIGVASYGAPPRTPKGCLGGRRTRRKSVPRNDDSSIRVEYQFTRIYFIFKFLDRLGEDLAVRVRGGGAIQLHLEPFRIHLMHVRQLHVAARTGFHRAR